MGCLWSNEKENNHSPPLSTRAIYSIIFKNNYIDKDNESRNDSEMSYRISPEM
jgi:hypothetical protein